MVLSKKMWVPVSFALLPFNVWYNTISLLATHDKQHASSGCKSASQSSSIKQSGTSSISLRGQLNKLTKYLITRILLYRLRLIWCCCLTVYRQLCSAEWRMNVLPIQSQTRTKFVYRSTR